MKLGSLTAADHSISDARVALSRSRSRKESSVYWKLEYQDDLSDPGDADREEEEEEVVMSDEFCCHGGCSFTYNVQESCLKRASFVMESVPQSTYHKLAPLLGMDPNKKFRTDGSNRCKRRDAVEEEGREVEDFIHLVGTELGVRSEASTDAQVEVGTYRRSVREEANLSAGGHDNPYLRFLRRASTGSGQAPPKYNLGRRSKEITRLIIKDFLEWCKSIGGDDEETTIDEATLQDLFQIGFDSPTARALALRIKEMPVVPESLASIRNEPEFAVRKGLRKLISLDIKLEEQRPKLFAFGRMLPKEKPCLRFQPPKNQVKKTWTECERVPPELESLQVVWQGIENLRSTIAFSNWLKNHPEITPPRYLREKGLLDVNYEEWMQKFKGFEKDVESEGADAESEGRELSDGEIFVRERSKTGKADEFMYEPSSYSLSWRT